MAYSIDVAGNLVLVQDGTVDQTATDLTLIGKNYTGFGQALNGNFVKLLENFSTSISAPEQPITGQLWYDTTVAKLKVYSGTAFVPVSSTTVAATQPLNMGVGDMWYNTITKQLNFWDGSSIILLGPTYTATQQRSGIVVYTVKDSVGQDHVITCIYNNGLLAGLFANETFTLQNPTSIAGYSPDGVIRAGFNQGTIPNFQFNINALDSAKLDGHAAIDYFRTGRESYTDHKIYIDSNDGLSVKMGNLKIDSNAVVLENTLSDQPLKLKAKHGNTMDTAIDIQPGSRTMYIGSSDVPYQMNLYQEPTINSSVTNKGYVDREILKKTLMLSIIIDNSTTDAQLLNIVTKMAPLDNNYPTDTAFRLLCSPVNPSAQKTIRVYRINSSGSWEFRPLENVTV
jgi:hypothetical protein